MGLLPAEIEGPMVMRLRSAQILVDVKYYAINESSHKLGIDQRDSLFPRRNLSQFGTLTLLNK